jgi:hypothetical protein
MIVSTDTATVLVRTDMTNQDYHAERDHISRSSAHRYAGEEGGPAQWYVETYGESLFGGNSATTFGTLVDLACDYEMQGLDWRSVIAVPPPGVLAADGSRRGKAFTEWRSSLPLGASECAAADFVKVERIIASIRAHRGANALLEAAAHTQYSVFWTDSEGHKRKARADGVTRSGQWFDIKTTSSEWRDLRFSFRRYGYDWQSQWYSDAAAVAGCPPSSFPFIVVQTFAPYRTKVVTLSQSVLLRAADEIRETLDLMRSRRESGLYFPDSYHEVSELDF